MDFRDLVHEIHGRIDALQIAVLFEKGEEGTQIGKTGNIAKPHLTWIFSDVPQRLDFGQ